MSKFRLFTVHGYTDMIDAPWLDEFDDFHAALDANGYCRCSESDYGYEYDMYVEFHERELSGKPRFIASVSNGNWVETVFIECGLAKLEWLRLYLPVIIASSEWDDKKHERMEDKA